jgi:hypothetical protein
MLYDLRILGLFDVNKVWSVFEETISNRQLSGGALLDNRQKSLYQKAAARTVLWLEARDVRGRTERETQ